MKQVTHFFFKVESPTLSALIWWKNEKDWTQALSSYCAIQHLSMFKVWDFI